MSHNLPQNKTEWSLEVILGPVPCQGCREPVVLARRQWDRYSLEPFPQWRNSAGELHRHDRHLPAVIGLGESTLTGIETAFGRKGTVGWAAVELGQVGEAEPVMP
jgi:hypothetical protein